jgi:hypothetical protein
MYKQEYTSSIYMFSYKSFIVTIVTAGTMFAAPIAMAQTTPAPFGGRGPIDEQDIYHPPEAYVLKADGKVQPDGTVQGTVTFWNKSKEILGDMTYTIELLGELPAATSENPIVDDNAPVYDVFSSKDRFVLIGEEKKTLPYTYTPPKSLPAGNYRVEITIANGRGRTLGWYDVPVTFTNEKTSFTELLPGDITIAEYGAEKFGAESGPNVAPGSSLTITANSSSATPRTVVPVINIHTFSPSRTLLRTVQGSRTNVDARETSLTMKVPTSLEPGIYIGMLSLQDAATNEQVSNIVKYRWVVRGPGADILHVRMQSYGQEKNETMAFAIDYVGSGDAETKTTTGKITIELRDSEGVLGSLSDPKAELSDKILTGEATIRLPRKISGEPVLGIRITEEDGSSLASYTIPYSFTPEQLRSLQSKKILSHILLYGGAGLALVGVLTLASNILKKKRKRKK